ncbi:hypothetical protein CR513_19220, partial [Mucuna pruriens]
MCRKDKSPKKESGLPQGQKEVEPFPTSSASKSMLGKKAHCLPCPNRRTMVLGKNGEVESGSSQEDTSSSSGGESSSECCHYEGDILMVRRLMSNLVGEEIKSQRETIFHSRKLCSLIIYGESSVNVGSLRLMEKLALPTLPHPRTYQLLWLSKKGGLVVDKKVFIGKYPWEIQG